ncbi:hypothetical protein GHT06_016053 [Daphnia sinensis]|uniref:Methyltransferase domain-containing protein n=1 Tax=Daphnia sinensis TaxID=1820382 RepID=A0AAD5KRS2_9CRUS|nr:hypothetical protein GHT06_016053 [Daphnia sinensis]
MSLLYYCNLKRGFNKCSAMFGMFLLAFGTLTLFQTFPTLQLNFTNPMEPREHSSYWDILLDSESLTGAQLLSYAMWTNRSSCKLAHDFGGLVFSNPSGIDGQKTVCIDPEVAPDPDECLVYSFGINHEWSFDEQIHNYGCEVFSFDPSMGFDHHDHSPGIHFYNWGLGDKDETSENGWAIRSLTSIYNNLTARHGNRIIDYLKIDVESAEWKALPEMIASGMMSKVRQLGIEVHFGVSETMAKNREWAKLLRSIEKMGMVRFDSKYNPWSIMNFTQIALFNVPFAYEIAWYNSKLSRVSDLL